MESEMMILETNKKLDQYWSTQNGDSCDSGDQRTQYLRKFEKSEHWTREDMEKGKTWTESKQHKRKEWKKKLIHLKL